MLVILSYSRLIESIRIPYLFIVGLSALLLYAFAFGTARNRFTFIPTFPLMTLSAWMVLSSIFGMWPSGSLRVLLNRWFGAVLLYVIIIMLPKSFRGHALVMGSMAWATAAILFLVRSRGIEVGGRLGIDDSSLGNSNDLALYLVVGLPFCATYALEKGKNAALRVLMALVFSYGLLTVLRTGSRMGLIALLAQGVALFLVGSGKTRAFLLLMVACTALGALLFLPEVVRARYFTWFEPAEASEENAQELQKAAGSAENRWELLKLSIKITGQHPFLGVGPGEFPDAVRELTAAPGVKGESHQTHNTYTQVSSECGIIPGLLYIGIVAFSLKAARRIRRTLERSPELQSARRHALCLYISTVAYAVCAFFGSLAYSVHLLLLCSLIISLDVILAATAVSPRAPEPPTAPMLLAPRPAFAGRTGGRQ